MRTIIAGSRSITRIIDVDKAMACCGWLPTVVLCGGASGVDSLGRDWANAHSIPIEEYPAQWRTPDGKLDRGAGIKRNCLMGDNADALVAIWDGTSHGTAHMIKYAKQKGLRIFVHKSDVASVSFLDFI